jgi:hypothetical protein
MDIKGGLKSLQNNFGSGIPEVIVSYKRPTKYFRLDPTILFISDLRNRLTLPKNAN